MKIRILTAGAAALALMAGLAGCASGGGEAPVSTDASKPYAGTTLKYWATNQGPSLDADAEILQPELDKFEEQTGIKVDLEVIPWSDMTNNTLAAAVSGQGPDVVNIGNTNATTLNTTGAFLPFEGADLEAIGGKDKFIESAWQSTGPEGVPPTSLPLYSQVYGLFYNKALFEDAGLEPPTTWEELVAAAKAITNPDTGTWGIVAPAGTVNVAMHIQYIFAAQAGGSPFDKDGNPDFETAANVEGVRQYLDLMSKDHVMNPSNAQFSDGGQATTEFAGGKIGMYMAQTGNVAGLRSNGMDTDQYGVVPIPAPKGGDPVGSFIAGTNISIFKNTKHKEAALEFVKFMTSEEESEILNKAFGTLPPVVGVPASAYADDPELMDMWTQILSENAIPMSQVPTVSAYQANVGGGVVGLFGQAATGTEITDDAIKAMLAEAQQKMATS
ncbi:sugar ABC transporter substrate-binding protein [Agromyces protaetiae]|uniref:Sugar ABC transporter substrate-binding protein n=1 Tax=Agromyces protaetiae TaxID=2509455 RepID=A0A4P6FCA1_9MICO|nr:sugar ABC transporter substrate-binding protein [Agromyces protaetiae]QAY73415.1 sugar ABC transporter substrate-binding protein [Agromyces protaetiae]